MLVRRLVEGVAREEIDAGDRVRERVAVRRELGGDVPAVAHRRKAPRERDEAGAVGAVGVPGRVALAIAAVARAFPTPAGRVEVHGAVGGLAVVEPRVDPLHAARHDRGARDLRDVGGDAFFAGRRRARDGGEQKGRDREGARRSSVFMTEPLIQQPCLSRAHVRSRSGRQSSALGSGHNAGRKKTLRSVTRGSVDRAIALTRAHTVTVRIREFAVERGREGARPRDGNCRACERETPSRRRVNDTSSRI